MNHIKSKDNHTHIHPTVILVVVFAALQMIAHTVYQTIIKIPYHRSFSDYMNSNKLKLNNDKTHLLVMTTSKNRRNNPTEIELTTSNEEINTEDSLSNMDTIIQPSASEKLLGVQIHEDLKWAEYIMHDEKSLIKQLTTRLNALILIYSCASFKTRLMIANGLFMSKLIYLIPLWSGCEKYLLKALQIIQNKAARLVTRSGYRTPIKTLLTQCGWLSIQQLACYHSLVLYYKILQSHSPQYLYGKISSEFPYRTRLASSNSVRIGPNFHANLEITKRSYR